MKKILLSLLMLCCMTAAWAIPVGDGTYTASSLSELQAAIKSSLSADGKTSAARIRLKADIDIRGLNSTLCEKFTGTIDGIDSVWVEGKDGKPGQMVRINHVIYGGEDKERTTCYWLFNRLEGATIRNVVFTRIRVQDDDNDEVGVIARHATGTTFYDIIVDSCSVFCDENRAGAVVGCAEGCDFQFVINRNCDVTVDGKEAGGIAGHSNGSNYYMCMTSLGSNVFADGSNASAVAYSGGFIGYSVNDHLTNCLNGAFVGANESHVGGLVGSSVYTDFWCCNNCANVVQCSESDFSKACADKRKKLDELKLSNSDIGLLTGLGTFAGLEGAFLVLLTSEYYMLDVVNLGWTIIQGLSIPTWSSPTVVTIANYGLDVPFNVAMAGIGTITAAIAVVAIAAGITAYIMQGDDEVGGICGDAKGGTFEQCTNLGNISGKDENVGGIVGRGKGVTINNCFNSGEIDYMATLTGGNILGRAEKDSDTGKVCKVTNCFGTQYLTIVGARDRDYIDRASGNNYRRIDPDNANNYGWWESLVEEDEVENGLLAYWLNMGVENIENKIQPWTQNLKQYHVKDYDKLPVLNRRDKVTLQKMASQTLISTPADLMAFRDRVNAGERDACARIINDIDMSGVDNWVPIGNDLNKSFRGIFDGGGFTIKNLKVNASGSGYQGAGLFGIISYHADIQNVIIGEGSEIVSDITGLDNGAAGIVGLVKNYMFWGTARIKNCGSYANVTSRNHAGGVVGRVKVTTVEYKEYEPEYPPFTLFVDSCWNAGIITTSEGNSALLCGYTQDNAVVSNCWSAGDICSTSSDVCPFDNTRTEPEYFVGYSEKLDIKNCVAGVNLMLANQNGVTKYINDAAATGELTYVLNGEDNNPSHKLMWKQELGVDAAPVSCRRYIGTDAEIILANNGVSYSREISAAQKPYGTICLPYAIQSNRYLDLFTFTEMKNDDGSISLCFTATDEVPAGTPALFRAHVNGTYDFFDAQLGYRFSPRMIYGEKDWSFYGTYTGTEFDGLSAESKYYISNQKDSEGKVTGVIRNAKKLTIDPFRAFFYGPNINSLSAAEAKAIQFVIDDADGETTALHFVGEDLVPQLNSKAYSLLGTEVNDSYRGIVIKNGKKYINR